MFNKLRKVFAKKPTTPVRGASASSRSSSYDAYYDPSSTYFCGASIADALQSLDDSPSPSHHHDSSPSSHDSGSSYSSDSSSSCDCGGGGDGGGGGD